jgi:hypothetical protein
MSPRARILSSALLFSAFALGSSAAGALPGPYRDDLDASIHGVRIGDSYLDRNTAIQKNAGGHRVHTLAIWGDSLMDVASTYRYTATVGSAGDLAQTGAVIYNLHPEISHPERYAVVQSNPGGTGPLTVSLDGTLLTVTLGRQNGVATSTIQDIHDAVARTCGDTFTVYLYDLFANRRAGASSQPVYFTPGSSYSATSAFTWLQTLTGQAFDFDRRATRTMLNPLSPLDEAGDWDYGYMYATALDLAAEPGPATDVLSSQADLIVGCVGVYDLSYDEPQQVCDHIVHLWDILQTADRDFVWMLLPPLNASDSETNDLLRQAAQQRGVVLIPWTGSILTSQGTVDPDIWGGGIGPSRAAAFQQAASMVDFFTPLLDSAPRYDLTPASWITANPAVTVDLKSGIAPGWQADDTGRVQLGDGKPDGQTVWEKITVAPPPPPVGGVIWDDSGASVTTLPSVTGWTVGDLVEGVAGFRVTDVARLQDVSIAVIFNGTNGQVSALDDSGLIPGTPLNSGSFDGVLRTPACAIPHGTTSISLRVTIRGGATLYLRNAGVRRLLAPGTDPYLSPVPVAGHTGLLRAPLHGLTATTHYAGSIYAYEDDDTQPGGHARGGFDSFTLSKTGAYSGRGRIDGVAFSIKGQLDPSGYGSSVIQLPAALTGGSTAPATLTLYFSTGESDATFRITGTLTGLSGDRPLAIDLVQTGPTRGIAYPAGLYTAIIPVPDDQDPATATAPGGSGVATMTLSSGGSLRCHYVLPDGTLGTRSAKLSGTGVWQFYFPASGSAAAHGGLLAGHVNFRSLPDPDGLSDNPISDLDGEISWTVPANPRSLLFPAGFDTQRVITGWKYEIPRKPDPALHGIIGSSMNATFSFNGSPFHADWGITSDIIQSSGLKARVNRSNGLVTGSGPDPVSRTKIRLYAVVLQNDSPQADGFFISAAAKAPAPGVPANGPVSFRPISRGGIGSGPPGGRH